jgi:hypothetical protein
MAFALSKMLLKLWIDIRELFLDGMMRESGTSRCPTTLLLAAYSTFVKNQTPF